MDKQQYSNTQPGTNKDLEGNDKAPGEEQDKAEKVTTADLKGKKNDPDLSLKKDRPLER